MTLRSTSNSRVPPTNAKQRHFEFARGWYAFCCFARSVAKDAIYVYPEYSRLWALLSEIAIYTDIYRNLPISAKSSIRIAIYRLIMINHDCFFDNCANITRKVTNLSQIFVIFRYIWHVSKIQTRYRENMNEFYRYLVITWIRDRFRYLSIKLVGNCGRYR